MNKVRVGQIGVGGFGRYRREKMRETGLFDLVAVSDLNSANLQSAATEEDATPFESLDELLAVPGLEGLVISTGATTHTDFAARAMQSGLHVFVEKPLCCSHAEADLLRRVQRETNRVVGVGHGDNADDPGYLLARQYIDDGLFGTVACYEENSSHSGGLEIRPGDWRGKASQNPGGMLFQCGVHAFHRLVGLFGPISELVAMMRYDVHTTETADVASVLIRHESGVTGTLNCYHVTAYCHELRIFGTRCNLYLSSQPQSAYVQERLRGAIETRVAVEFPVPANSGGTGNLINWYNAIRGVGEARPGLEHGIAAVLPVFAAEESVQSKGIVPMISDPSAV